MRENCTSGSEGRAEVAALGCRLPRPDTDAGQRGELVHDDVGLRGHDRVEHRRGVERVEHDGLGAERAHAVGVRAGGPGDVVPAFDQLGDEAAPERARGAGEEDA